MLTFNVAGGKTMNIVAFRTDPNDWPDHTRLTKSAKREQALKDFEGWGSDVTELLKLTKPDLDVVGSKKSLLLRLSSCLLPLPPVSLSQYNYTEL